MTRNVKISVIDSNRRLQEAAQKLLMAKKDLEVKNEAAEKKEKDRNAELKRELAGLRRLARPAATGRVGGSSGRRLTSAIAQELSLQYGRLVESYWRTKDLNRDGRLVDELCRALIEVGITPKGLVSLHLGSLPQLGTIDSLNTKRMAFESRMVLLRVMTSYATILHERSAIREEG